MNVSPTSSSLTTKVLIAVIVSALSVCGLSMRYMAPSDKTISMGWFANAVVGEGSEEAAEASVKEYFNAVNNKDYDKAFTYVIDQAKANPIEKQKWIESMKNGPKGKRCLFRCFSSEPRRQFETHYLRGELANDKTW